MSGRNHKYELVQITEQEFDEHCRAQSAVRAPPRYFCVTRHDEIRIWPRPANRNKLLLTIQVETIG